MISSTPAAIFNRAMLKFLTSRLQRHPTTHRFPIQFLIRMIAIGEGQYPHRKFNQTMFVQTMIKRKSHMVHYFEASGEQPGRTKLLFDGSFQIK